MKTILLPLDGSACAEQVLRCVRLLAQLLQAQVRLVHSVDGELAPYREIEQRAWETLRQQAEIYLAAASPPNVLGMSGGHA